AHDRQTMSLPGNARDVLTDKDAGHSRRDGLELAAHLAGGVRLEVPDILMGGSTEQKGEDTGPRPAEVALPGEMRGRLGSLAEQLGQSQTQGTQSTGAQPLSPRQSFAQRYAGARQRDHWCPLDNVISTATFLRQLNQDSLLPRIVPSVRPV